MGSAVENGSLGLKHEGRPAVEQLPASIVIPCLNEERTIHTCVTKARYGLEAIGYAGEIIVSDNGSSDRSVSRALDAGARVVHCTHRGYGSAIRYGVAKAKGTHIIIGDGDDSYDFTNVRPFIETLEAGADVVIGDRFGGGILPGAMPWANRHIGNPLITLLLNRLFGAHISDTQCGMRGLSHAAFRRLNLRCDGMEFASEMLVRAVQLRLRIAEIPIQLHPDGRGRRPHLRPVRDGLRIVRFLLGERFGREDDSPLDCQAPPKSALPPSSGQSA